VGEGRGVSMDVRSKSFEVFVLCQRRDVACRPAKSATSRLGRTNLAVIDILSSTSLLNQRQLSIRFCSVVVCDQMFDTPTLDLVGCRLFVVGCGLSGCYCDYAFALGI
jgi:hypothetical protein